MAKRVLDKRSDAISGGGGRSAGEVAEEFAVRVPFVSSIDYLVGTGYRFFHRSVVFVYMHDCICKIHMSMTS